MWHELNELDEMDALDAIVLLMLNLYIISAGVSHGRPT